MSALDLAASAVEGRTSLRRPWVTELCATLALAAPLVLTNLAQHGLITSDTVILGRLGAPELAAATSSAASA